MLRIVVGWITIITGRTVAWIIAPAVFAGMCLEQSYGFIRLTQDKENYYEILSSQMDQHKGADQCEIHLLA